MTNLLEIPDTICRICLGDEEELEVSVSACADLIRNVAGIEFLQDSGLPEMICRSCFEALQNANRIRELCLESKKQLEDVVTVVKCCLCSECFDEVEELTEHVWKEHSVKIKQELDESIQCPICLHIFKSRNEKDLHRTCEVCYKSFSNDNTLQKHLICHGIVNDEELAPNELKERKRKKPRIEKETSGNVDEPNIKYKTSRCCCQCDIRFGTLKERNDHFKSTHKDAIKPNPNPSKYACFLCFEEFSNMKDRISHIRNGYGTFKCTECPLAFVNQRQISKHYEYVHKIPQIYTCPLCDKKFVKLVSYDSHIHHFHSEKSKYRCDLCSKVYNRKHDLEEHMNAHLGLKPFQCHVCVAGFPRITGLKAHLRSHTGEKPYKCKYCEKRYGHSSDLKRHTFTHTNNYPFVCEICGKGFTRQQNFESHKATKRCKNTLKFMTEGSEVVRVTISSQND